MEKNSVVERTCWGHYFCYILFVIHSGVFVQAHLHLAVAVLLAHVVAEVVEA